MIPEPSYEEERRPPPGPTPSTACDRVRSLMLGHPGIETSYEHRVELLYVGGEVQLRCFSAVVERRQCEEIPRRGETLIGIRYTVVAVELLTDLTVDIFILYVARSFFLCKHAQGPLHPHADLITLHNILYVVSYAVLYSAGLQRPCF